ncbi:benzoate/H(+) symporter BenE family transporter [Paenibacillus glycanilyticus]|uniref:benzoate/H(+) symporter BenE family transporter n=1 Tax=Paenibacillus glycanilyticus TaxID=126569 RepID=UPI00203B3DB5|nr:benzoate/H(+) symporter BenE family transporter [Paenibacillus glycanilyticus]MCM3626075.1 benzoate/H(+) symporter BenE family transporter [Paenibacillus glycanilyticus]
MKFITTGIMSALLACTGGALLLVKAAEMAGLPDRELLSWFFAVYVMGGLLNAFLTLKYKIPFAGAHSITGIAFVGSVAANYPLPVLTGGFILSGLLMIVVGSTGLFGRALRFVPKPIIDALLAGLLFSSIWGMIPSAIQLPLCGMMAAVGYWMIPRFVKFLPPVIWSLMLGVVGLLLQNRLPWREVAAMPFQLPTLIMPEFTVFGLFSIAIPLALLIMSNDLAVALASLKGHHYDPPVNKAMAASGVAAMAAGMLGGHAANVGGMMTALCSSPEAGSHWRRIGAALTSNVLVILFGLFAWKMIGWLQIMPAPFLSMMTGIPLLGLFIHSVKSVVRERKLIIPTISTFLIAALHINLFGLSAPLWALLAGVALVYLRQKFVNRKGGLQDEA